MNLPPPPPPPQDDDPIITQFRPVDGQWELNDDNINRIDPETGETILHNYCEQINTTPREVYRYLIEVKGCDVNVQAKNNNTPLHDALRYFDPRNGGDINVLAYLIAQKGVNADIKGQYGYTILDIACININAFPLEIFKLLIETLGGDVNALDEYDNTPLHQAIGCFNKNDGGDISVLQYLFDQTKAHVNTKGEGGNTILHYACEMINYCVIDVFKFLIETLGCDVNAQNNDKNTPLHRAFRFFNPSNGSDITVLTYLLNQTNADVNIKGKRDHTILHLACERINYLPLDIFKVLIETQGFDVNTQDKYNDTPLHVAFRYFDPNTGGDITALTYLINQTNISVNVKYNNGYTLLHSACTVNLSNKRYSMKIDAECDTIGCQIVEMIAERCVQEMLEEETSLEAATTT
jgi:ankyrin repeat protein